MAPQSARRDRKNQGFPPCYSSTLLGDLDPVRELPYGLAAQELHQKPDRWQHPTRCHTNPKTACAQGGVHRWKGDIVSAPYKHDLHQCGLAIKDQG